MLGKDSEKLFFPYLFSTFIKKYLLLLIEYQVHIIIVFHLYRIILPLLLVHFDLLLAIIVVIVIVILIFLLPLLVDSNLFRVVKYV